MSVKLGRNDPCWCGSGKKYKVCHAAFDDKLARLAQEGHVVPTHDLIKTPDQIAGIKESAKINVAVLDYIEKNIHAGMNTAEIDKIVYDMTTSMGGIPAPLNYEGYPYSVCTSVNEQVCHGFPSEKVILKEGDIINVDCSTILNGYFSDSSRMFCIGEVSPEKKKLVQVTKECVELGLKEVKPWGFWVIWVRQFTIMLMLTGIPLYVKLAVTVSAWNFMRSRGLVIIPNEEPRWYLRRV